MKKIKILTITLLIALITMIAFFGIYVQKQNRMENIIKDNSYAMDLNGARTVKFVVSKENKTVIKDAEGKEVKNSENLTDEQIAEKGYTKEEVPYNSEDVKNVENYEESKRIIKERLSKLGLSNYTIKLDENTGDIILELTEDDITDYIVSNIYTKGDFKIIDTENNEVLMDNNDIKTAKVLYGASSTGSGTNVYLDIEFTKEGAKKLEDISNKYVESENTQDKAEADNTAANNTTADNTTADNTTTNNTTTNNTTTDNNTNTNNVETNETAENTANSEENQEETTTKTITMKIDDQEIMSTSFEEPIKTGKLQLSVGATATSEDTLKDYVDQATSMGVVLDTGKLPITYEVEQNEYILSDITSNDLQILIYILTGIMVVALIVLIIRYKALGALGTISYIGLLSIFMIILKYTNVTLSIEGILGIIVALVLNYIFINKILNKIKANEEISEVNKNLKSIYKDFFVKLIPVIIMVIAFCFINWVPISSFGMTMFWGIVLIASFNILITNNLLKIQIKE